MLDIKTMITGAVLITILTLELIIPNQKEKGKLKHDIQNGSLFIINAVLIAIILTPIIIYSTSLNIGLFSIDKFPLIIELLITILTLDILTYWLHRYYHISPFFWRFHKVHHGDTKMNVTTSARFHIGEHIASTLVKVPVYIFLAARLEIIIIYEAVFLINVMIHHSNLNLPKKMEKVYRLFFASPAMHKIHHSNKKEETNSNYTSLFSVWDRIWNSYTKPNKKRKITFGIKGLENKQEVLDMLKTPLSKTKT